MVQPEDCNANGKNTCIDPVAHIFKAIPNSFNIAAVLIVVAAPEGLPLLMGVSIAFSVARMNKNDKILLRK